MWTRTSLVEFHADANLLDDWFSCMIKLRLVSDATSVSMFNCLDQCCTVCRTTEAHHYYFDAWPFEKKKYYCIAQDVRYNRITTQNIYSYTSQKLQSNPLWISLNITRLDWNAVWNTVGDCKIMHHQKDGWNPNKIMGCVPPFSTGVGFLPSTVSNMNHHWWRPAAQVELVVAGWLPPRVPWSHLLTRLPTFQA